MVFFTLEVADFQLKQLNLVGGLEELLLRLTELEAEFQHSSLAVTTSAARLLHKQVR